MSQVSVGDITFDVIDAHNEFLFLEEDTQTVAPDTFHRLTSRAYHVSNTAFFDDLGACFSHHARALDKMLRLDLPRMKCVINGRHVRSLPDMRSVLQFWPDNDWTRKVRMLPTQCALGMPLDMLMRACPQNHTIMECPTHIVGDAMRQLRVDIHAQYWRIEKCLACCHVGLCGTGGLTVACLVKLTLSQRRGSPHVQIMVQTL